MPSDSRRPLPPPIRVLVNGGSTVVQQSTRANERPGLSLSRLIEAKLFAAGCPAIVHTEARPGGSSRTLLRTVDRDLVAWTPDVIILHTGHYESINLFIPRWFERHTMTTAARPTPIRSFYRHKVLRKVYGLVRRVQTQADKKSPTLLWRTELKHILAVTERYIQLAHRGGSPLVILVGTLPPAARFANPFPGMAERVELLNDGLRSLAESIALPDVVYLDTEALLLGDGSDLEEVAPDGAHYTRDWNERLGAALSARILEWAEKQDHLQIPH
ncbi:SGNH/GDSL hydrolase family protein [Smaragdicoccus niigatensis]|uniref:SGNH/GDSL hydrolase family protein n=1 Tax=Smaragdicoccus niigatensis TaxID=359359 RepID=UPI0003612494|nr:SGNH/GDSL hydrolase family protein [Smaragdicoccus niigatensis]